APNNRTCPNIPEHSSGCTAERTRTPPYRGVRYVRQPVRRAGLQGSRVALVAAWRALEEAERRAGARGRGAIAAAERDAALLPAADAALDRLPTFTYRRALATFLAVLDG